MLKSFVVGVIAGGVAYWLWEDEIRRFVDANTLDIRKRAADTLKQAESLVESASETIGQTIHAQSADVLQVEAGSLYPALQRLAKKGWVTAKWGQTDANQRAKFYRLTPEGKKQLVREESRWTELVNAIGRVMKPAVAPGSDD